MKTSLIGLTTFALLSSPALAQELDLIKRSETTTPLTAAQFDANMSAIEDAFNNLGSIAHEDVPLPLESGGCSATSPETCRTSLSLVPGINVQVFDPDLATYAGVTPGATGLALLDDATQTAARATIAAQASSANLTTLAAVTPGAVGLDVLDETTKPGALTAIGAQPLATSLTTLAGTTLGATGLALLDDTTPAAGRATIAAQAASAGLDTLAGITLGTTGLALLDDVTAADARTTIAAQANSTNLSTLAAVTPGVVGLNLLDEITPAGARGVISAQQQSATLDTVGGITLGATGQALLDDTTQTAARTTIAAQAASGNLDTLSGVTSGATGRAVLGADTPTAARATLGIPRVISYNQRILPPQSGNATVDIRNGGSSPAESFQVWDFNDAADQCVDISGIIPPSALTAGANVSLSFSWVATTATTGSVVWTGGPRNLFNEDLDTSQTYATQAATTATDATSGILTPTTITYTSAQIDGLIAGQPYIWRLCRDADNGSDTMVGDAELLEASVLLSES